MKKNLLEEACYVFTKEQITEVLIFLKTFAQMLGNEEVEENLYVSFIQKELTRQTWYRHAESEFQYFADYAEVFEDWENKIQKSKNLYFYWENSF